MIEITAFGWVPPFAQGLVRDLRVRWALEEVGLDYTERLVDTDDQASEAYRRLQPFGQVPTYRDDSVELFESGAIVLHIAEQSDVLLPTEANARARAKAWVFAALNSIEPDIQNLASIDLFYAEQAWAIERRPSAVEMVEERLADLSAWLGDREYLEGGFTVGDLMMVTVLRILRHTDLVAQYPTLHSYCLRCEARPAFRKALADQMAPFAQHKVSHVL